MAKTITRVERVVEKPIDLADLNKKLDLFESEFCKELPIPNAKQDVYPTTSKGQVHYSDSAKALHKEMRGDVANLRKKLARLSRAVKYYEVAT